MLHSRHKMVTIRRATREDTPWLLTQIRAFEKFANYKTPLTPSEEKALEILGAMVEAHVVFIADDQTGQRLGFIAGYAARHPLSPNLRVLSELFWWVIPEERHSSAGMRLLDAFEKHGRETADWTVVSLEHNSPVRDETLTRRGFRLTERAFVLEV